MMHAEATRTRSKVFPKVGPWCASVSFAATIAALGIWLFVNVPDLRRYLVLASLGCALLCVLGIVLQQRSAGGRRPLGEIAEAACDQAAERGHDSGADVTALPRTLPSRRGQQFRSLAWVIGLSTVLIGVFALAVGSPQRSELVERIHSAGAEFGVARAEKVTDVQRKSSRGKDPYTATVVVQLPAKTGAEYVSATVKPTTNEPLSPGDPVTVLYAPAEPRLGAVAGDERSLGAELRGETMPAYLRWLFVAAWVLSCVAAVGHVSAKHGFRSYARLGKQDKAIRGQYTRVGGPGVFAGPGSQGKDVYLEIRTDSGWVHFRTGVGKHVLPEVMEGQQLWLCWDAHRGVRGSRISPSRTSAALVFDTGLVVHGMVSVDEMRSLSDSGVSVGRLSPPPRGDRSLQLFDPRSQWPLLVEPLALQTCVVVIACASVLTFDVTTGWRWAAGIVGFLGAFAASGSYVSEDAPPERAAASR
ncbi:hypothetical protein ACHBTE_18005 [Streptomyces sp. M41]|uniref:hypothetical protein n=1 Tax=Streptomyces sp. M41 TaxID=3059412 RepID=UPI00374D34F3